MHRTSFQADKFRRPLSRNQTHTKFALIVVAKFIQPYALD